MVHAGCEQQQGAPYVGEILEAAFARATAAIVLLTPDEECSLHQKLSRPSDREEEKHGRQPRPNVLFEAGMAFGYAPRRTILIEMGSVRPFSDVAGRYVFRFDGAPDVRAALAEQLSRAGCRVQRDGTEWLSAGNFSSEHLFPADE